MEKYENQLRGLLDRKKEILDKKSLLVTIWNSLYSQEEEIENNLKNGR